MDYVQETFGDLVGKKIARVRQLSRGELDTLMWSSSRVTPIVIEFSDGAYIIPMCDEEGNGAGGLCFADSTGFVRS